MSNKLTSKKLNELIREILQEKTDYPFEIPGDIKKLFRTSKKYADAKKDFGDDDDDEFKNRLDRLADLDSPINKIDTGDFDDLDTLDKGEDQQDAFQAAQAIAQHGRSARVKKIAQTGLDDASNRSQERKVAKDINITNDTELATALNKIKNFNFPQPKVVVAKKIKTYEQAKVTALGPVDSSNISAAKTLHDSLYTTDVKDNLKAQIANLVNNGFDDLKAAGKIKDIKRLYNAYGDFMDATKADEAKSMYQMPDEDSPNQSLIGRDLQVKTQDPTSMPFGELNVTYTNLAPKGETFANTKTKRVINLKVSEGVLANIEAIKGNSLDQKLISVGEFAKAVKDDNLSGYSIGQITSNMRVLGFLADAAIEYEQASAGTIFEVFLALLSKGYVIGAESGTTDLLGISGGKPIYYSAKFYSDQNIKQSDQADIGIGAVVKQATEEDLKLGLIYIIGIKTVLDHSQIIGNPAWDDVMPKNKKPKAVAIAAIRLKGDDTSPGALEVTALKAGGKEVVIVKKVTPSGNDYNFNSVMTEIKEKNNWLAYVPIFEGIQTTAGETATNAAEYLSKKVDKTKNTALLALKKAYANLKKIEDISSVYEAKADGSNYQVHNTYIRRIGYEYSDFKANYNSALVGDTRSKGLTGATGATARITENKTKSIKDLDKLIERVILESMNKK